MSRIIVIHWEIAALRVAVLNPAGNRAEVEAVVSVPLEGDDISIGVRLASALERFAPSRGKVIAAVGRQLLTWQHLSLPPCPADDLPDLVRLQSDYSATSSDDPAGLDFLPLAGDEMTSHRVWAISVGAAHLAKFRRITQAADLKIERLMPLALGWPAWARHAAKGGRERATISIAPQGSEPTIWATVGERLVLFRQLQLSHTDAESHIHAIAGEIRRTLLAFAQEQPQAGDPIVQLVGERGENLERLASDLTGKLQRQVKTLAAAAPSQQDLPLPVMGLALDEAAGIAPVADLLHPRRRPAPRTSRRTYTLAAVAAASLVLLVGWRAYSNLRAPLEAVEAAQAEIKLLDASSATLREAEQRANSVRTWLNGSVNLLEELEVLSTHVRPQPLKAESFPADTDVVVGKVVLQSRQFTIDAMAKENRVVQPLEYRLRDGIHRVQRGKTERSEAVPGYPLAFQSIVDVTIGGTAEEAVQP